MDKIAKIFGGALLCGICFTMLFTLVFHSADGNGNEGILKMVGSKFGGMWSDESTEGFRVYETEAAKEFPQITYAAAGALGVGVYELGTVVKAYDYMGNPVQVKISSMTLPDGTEKKGLEKTTQLTFQSPGIYVLKLKAKDNWNRESIKEVKIPVNN